MDCKEPGDKPLCLWAMLPWIYFTLPSYSSYIPHFIHRSHQELQRRAPSTGLRTGPRTSSWSWRTAWRSERGTNRRSLSRYRKCSPSTNQHMPRTWSRSSRACLMGPQNGRQRSASLVSLFLIWIMDLRREGHKGQLVLCSLLNYWWEQFIWLLWPDLYIVIQLRGFSLNVSCLFLSGVCSGLAG